MYEWMMAEFKRTVPELAMYEFNTNDAGGGFCWAAALYSGPNGPRHCRHRSAGQRVRSFLDSLNRGAEKGGGKIDIRIDHANFWQNERDVVRPLLPPNAILASPDPSVIRASTAIGDGYPILGLFNPASTLESLERANDEAVRWVDVSVGVPYTRAHEKLNVIERLLEIVDDAVREPARGMLPRIQKLRRFCARWAGEKHADDLSEAFLMFQDCLRTASMLAPHFTPIYSGLSMRLLTRPLVIKPELLAPQEEAYFLPFIFNPDEQEARCDYNDWHGGRVQVNVMAEANSFPAFQQVLARAQSAARKIEAASAAPDAAWLRQISQSVRIWASTMRSCHNFYFAQLIRDRNRQALAYPAAFPSKTESWSGHPDILPWNELMRDEFDNTLELIALLEDGGLEMVSRAENPAGEDSFVLGPDLIGALKKKAGIMREHWLDIEKYLAPPHK
jgi:hypothetical protein